ncbi:FAD-dependent monooxygenase [Actinocorallia longicatena]|uniref:FAD-dependent monooxygenase n=1 Tax=Actinocorallia longicatena TaxID=111803 RepID=A0ABP6Q1W8_9ACTN
MPTAVIIGAGIGGLTAGIALGRRGWTVTVYERAPELRPVGSGLAIAANALKALDVLDLGDRVRELSRVQGMAALRTARGRYLSHIPEERISARYGDSVVLLKRAALQDLLVNALPPGVLHLGTEARLMDADRGLVEASGETLEADLVVAADGIGSPARAALFPSHPEPVYAGFTAWRALVSAPGRFEATETWGEGSAFGVMPMADDTVYLYATATVPLGTIYPDDRAELLRRFAHWHTPIPHLLSLLDPAHVIRNDVHHLTPPLPTVHRGRTVLLGDAAHPMTPNLGQGACQAIEDALVLAHIPDPATYTATRLPRTTKIASRSASVARAVSLTSPWATTLRDTAMRLTSCLPMGLFLRSLDDPLGWTPPQ